MKTIQLYITGKRNIFFSEVETKYVGLLVYGEYSKLYGGRLKERDIITALFYGILHGKEALKETVNIEVKTNLKELVVFVEKPKYYCPPLQKLKNYSGQINWHIFSKEDPYGKFILEKLRSGG